MAKYSRYFNLLEFDDPRLERIRKEQKSFVKKTQKSYGKVEYGIIHCNKYGQQIKTNNKRG